MQNEIRTILEAFYHNGRWGRQRASVYEQDGFYYFNNGFADPLRCDDLADAEAYFTAFLADRKPVKQIGVMLEYA